VEVGFAWRVSPQRGVTSGGKGSSKHAEVRMREREEARFPGKKGPRGRFPMTLTQKKEKTMGGRRGV